MKAVQQRKGAWLYLSVLAILLLAVILTGILVWDKGGRKEPPVSQKNREFAEKAKQIQNLEERIAQLRRELDRGSERIAGLEAKLRETRSALESAREKLKEIPPSKAPQRDDALGGTKTGTRSEPEKKAPVWTKPAEPGIYETIRDTPVYEEPSESSRQVASIQKGMRARVIGSAGDWLEVRSKHGRPPGFIRREDAMFVQKER